MEKCHTSKWPYNWLLGVITPINGGMAMDFFGIRPPGLQRSDDSNSKPQWQAGQTSRDTAQNLSKNGWKKETLPGSPRRPIKIVLWDLHRSTSSTPHTHWRPSKKSEGFNLR